MRKELVFYAGRLWKKGFFPGTSGNVSVRLPDGSILVTPSGKAKDMLSPEDLTRVDLEGNVLEGRLRPSSELKMHLAAYSARSDVNAVVHAHPPFVVAACCAGGVDAGLLAESTIIFGRVPLAPFALPSTSDVPDSIRPFLGDSNGILLSHHGGLTFGATLEEASNRFEALETLCRVTFILRSSGVGEPLSASQLEALRGLASRR